MQFDLFDQGSDSQPGERQTDLEMLIEERAFLSDDEKRHVAGFEGRVNRAAAHMAANRPVTRALDCCFENFDGEAVAHALFRRAAKNPSGKLAQNIGRYLQGEVNEAPKENGPKMSLEELRALSIKNFKARSKK